MSKIDSKYYFSAVSKHNYIHIMWIPLIVEEPSYIAIAQTTFFILLPVCGAYLITKAYTHIKDHIGLLKNLPRQWKEKQKQKQKFCMNIHRIMVGVLI